MKEVAERAGVAISSVSRVISGHPDVSEAMRARVMKAIEELEFRPDARAQSLRTGSTHTIGFIAADISNPLFAEIATGAEIELRAWNYSMLVANAFNDAELVREQLLLMEHRSVDGLLLSVSDETDPELQAVLQRMPFPITLIDRDVRGFTGSAVLSDHAAGLEEAVACLVSLGHRRIALVNGSEKVRPSRERAATLRRALEHADGVVPELRMGEFSAEYGYAATRELMAKSARPTAVIAGSNQILMGVLQALRDLALTVPDDVSLVSCDDLPVLSFLDPPVSTIARDPLAMGTQAAQLVLEEIDGAAPKSVVLATEFRRTASCGAPAAP
ncbi:MAG: LacI family transcriptional regulator [Microbacterium sp.]|nr:LacI family transcriptional regulator [Microbacterium sp.]